MTVRGRRGKERGGGQCSEGLRMEVDESLATRQRLVKKEADCFCISSSIILFPRDLENIHSQTPPIRHRTAE